MGQQTRNTRLTWSNNWRKLASRMIRRLSVCSRSSSWGAGKISVNGAYSSQSSLEIFIRAHCTMDCLVLSVMSRSTYQTSKSSCSAMAQDVQPPCSSSESHLAIATSNKRPPLKRDLHDANALVQKSTTRS